MKKAQTYKNSACAAILETAVGMYEAGVMDKQTMRSFDHACLTLIREFSGEILVDVQVNGRVNDPLPKQQSQNWTNEPPTN